MNGDSNQLQGVYAPGLFADVVLQQPAGYPSFVSRDPQALTQYASASDLGSTGLLAHSFLAGRRFPLMRKGQIIHLIYGDGRIESFVVARLLRYRALQPNSVHSSFEDLAGGGRLDASTLFQRVYGHRGALVLQTCIEFDGSPNWGRLFVIAAPTKASEILPSLCPNCR
jgi:hypothetical protein